MMKLCPVCSSDNCIRLNELYDDRYGYKGFFLMAKCNSCGHKYLDGEFTPEMLAVFYSKYGRRSDCEPEQHRPHGEMAKSKAWLDGSRSFAFRRVPKNVRVLDIGCGMGETLGYHKARGCDVYGVEADANVLRVADKFGYKVQVGLFDPLLFDENFFDYVTMDQVLEHTTNPIGVLKGLVRILKPEGCAIISLPNSNGWGMRVFGRKWVSWHVPYHLQHFSLESMKIAAEKAGLKLEEHKIITSSEWLNYQWLHLLTYPKEGEPSAFWTARELTRMQAFIYHLISLAKEAGINSLITRFFDWLKLGDNCIFVLRKAA